MSGAERRRLFVLGLPTFGMALSITTISTYLPVLASGQKALASGFLADRRELASAA